MSLFRCTVCGCKENSALGDFHGANMDKRPVRCSECATGTWHGRFPKVSAAGMLIDNHGGLWTVDQRIAGMVPKAYKIVGTVRPLHEYVADAMMGTVAIQATGISRVDVLAALHEKYPTEAGLSAKWIALSREIQQIADEVHRTGGSLGFAYPELGIAVLEDGTRVAIRPKTLDS